MILTGFSLTETICIAGALGGVISALIPDSKLNQTSDKSPSWISSSNALPKIDWSRAGDFIFSLISKVLIGIGAAFLVPLFLNTLESNLVHDLTEDGTTDQLFVFFGFCLLAAISAQSFIASLSGRVFSETLKRQGQQIQKGIQELKDWSPSEVMARDFATLFMKTTDADLNADWIDLSQEQLIALLRSYEDVLMAIPEDINALLGKARSLTSLGRYIEADALLSGIISQYLNDPAILGRTYYSLSFSQYLAVGPTGDFSEALTTLEKAISLMPELKNVARSDEDFRLLHDNQVFQDLMLDAQDSED